MNTQDTTATTTTESHTAAPRSQRSQDLRTAGIALGVVVGFKITYGLVADGVDWAKDKLAARKAEDKTKATV